MPQLCSDYRKWRNSCFLLFLISYLITCEKKASALHDKYSSFKLNTYQCKMKYLTEPLDLPVYSTITVIEFKNLSHFLHISTTSSYFEDRIDFISH
jgi:hypothetical protein